ncbi:uncharacterized protein VP01_1373g6 [Puccinia sorghi]|uniref:Tet-like 2OG-Fe(II) oxygenase domain-containing protein n=1 Tax=Puccinia sorghi TaxID=27349 RepID=A0A0L6VLL4_9BASI|nr:uncharacterized protein VP01_1373g6 [Puccinia sorghi]
MPSCFACLDLASEPGIFPGGTTGCRSKHHFSGKRVRPGRMIKRWAHLCERAGEPFLPHDQGGMEDEEPEDSGESLVVENGEFVYYYLVPPNRQHDPTLAKHSPSQVPMSVTTKSTCVIAPRGKEAFFQVKFMPFSSMSPKEIQGWEKLVCFFLNHTNCVEAVKNNEPHMGGAMYCLVQCLEAMIQQCLYNAADEAASLWEANNWIAIHLQEMAPGIFDKSHEVLLAILPSMGSMEYHTPYKALDFASFFTFTMFWVSHSVFSNQMTPTRTNTPGLDCRAASTLKRVSHSDKYTRIGFSCQISERMSDEVIAGQQVQIANAEARLARKR